MDKKLYLLNTYDAIHFKGGKCTLIAQGTMATTDTNVDGEKAVIYLDENGKIYIRPVSEFIQFVNADGKLVPRFDVRELPVNLKYRLKEIDLNG